MLTRFGPEIWLCDGPVAIGAAGFRFPTRMVVMRLSDRRLVVWSPVDLTPDLAAEVRALGRVSHLIAPNVLHDTWIGAWARTFPQAHLHGAEGLRGRHPDLAWGRDLSATADPAWAGDIDQVPIPNRIAPETVFHHRASGTVLFTDLIQHIPPGWFTGWRAAIARLDLMSVPHPEVPRKFRLAITDRAAARSAVRRILAWDARAVVFAHGPPVMADASGVLRHAFRWLRV